MENILLDEEGKILVLFSPPLPRKRKMQPTGAICSYPEFF